MRKKVRETELNAEAFALWREGKGPNPQSLDLEQTFEIDLYENDDQVIGLLNTMLKDLLKIDQLISNSLKDWISTPLSEYINYLKKSNAFHFKLPHSHHEPS